MSPMAKKKQEPPPPKKSTDPRYEKLMADVAKSNPSFVKWLRSRDRKPPDKSRP